MPPPPNNGLVAHRLEGFWGYNDWKYLLFKALEGLSDCNQQEDTKYSTGKHIFSVQGALVSRNVVNRSRSTGGNTSWAVLFKAGLAHQAM